MPGTKSINGILIGTNIQWYNFSDEHFFNHSLKIKVLVLNTALKNIPYGKNAIRSNLSSIIIPKINPDMSTFNNYTQTKGKNKREMRN